MPGVCRSGKGTHYEAYQTGVCVMTAPFISAQELLSHQMRRQVELVLGGDPTPVKLIAVGAVKGNEFALVKIFDPVKRVDEPQRIAMNEIQEVRLSE